MFELTPMQYALIYSIAGHAAQSAKLENALRNPNIFVVEKSGLNTSIYDINFMLLVFLLLKAPEYIDLSKMPDNDKWNEYRKVLRKLSCIKETETKIKIDLDKLDESKISNIKPSKVAEQLIEVEDLNNFEKIFEDIFDFKFHIATNDMPSVKRRRVGECIEYRFVPALPEASSEHGGLPLPAVPVYSGIGVNTAAATTAAAASDESRLDAVEKHVSGPVVVPVPPLVLDPSIKLPPVVPLPLSPTARLLADQPAANSNGFIGSLGFFSSDTVVYDYPGSSVDATLSVLPSSQSTKL
jgi:hypothetical protein